MKISLILNLALLALLVNSCTNVQSQASKTNFTAIEFAAKLKELPSAPIIDVRSAEEFSKGHLEHAMNLNWNGENFEMEIIKLDKTKPVFVYCLSGGRSAAASNHMRSIGFQQVYELDGGLMKWRSANLPETTNTAASSTGLTKEQFFTMLKTDKLVLVDFYADWCAPCKKMKPYLEEISNELSGKVIVMRINVDDNKTLCKELNISDLPVLHLYKNNNLIWSNIGFIEKTEVVTQLQK